MSDYKRGDKPKGRDYTYILQWMEYAETLEAKCAQLEGENAQLRKNDDEYFAKCKILTINNINLHAECERLRQLFKEAADYLDINEHTSIGSGSILHRKFKAQLTKEQS